MVIMHTLIRYSSELIDWMMYKTVSAQDCWSQIICLL